MLGVTLFIVGALEFLADSFVWDIPNLVCFYSIFNGWPDEGH